MTPDWFDVLEFWFGAPGSPELGRNRKQWFEKSDAFDGLIRERFLATHEAAAGGRLDGWADRPLAALALVVALDQFPRNMFRGTPRAFATDAKALAVARGIVSRGFDRGLRAGPALVRLPPVRARRGPRRASRVACALRGTAR